MLRPTPMEDQQLCGIEINLHLSQNPKIYYMYDRPELGREIGTFFKDNGLRVVGAGVAGSEFGSNPTHIKVEGSGFAVVKLVAEYLSDDPPTGVYTLLYSDAT
jgi:hypothetical protein